MTEVESKAEAGSRGDHSKAYAGLIATGIFLSRIFGLIRERAIAHYLGAGNATGAFKAALRIPNFLQNLFGEGVLSASLIPVYAKLIAEEDEEVAGRVAGAVAAFLTLIICLLVVLGILLSPLLVDLIAPGFKGEVRELTISLVRVLFPGSGLLVLSAWCLGILNSHRKFFLSYVAPVLWNLTMIATLIVFGGRLANFSLATALAWGTVAGSALQVGVQIPFVVRYAPKMKFALDAMLEPVREVGRNFLPVVTGRGVVQVSAFIDGIIVSFLGAPTVAILTFAHIIYILPVSLFGMSVAASELPQMSSLFGEEDEVNRMLRDRLERGLRQISYFVIPSAIAFIAIGDVIVGGVYQTGEFGRNDTLFSWLVLATFAFGLLPITLSRLYSSTFYALRDTRTPLRISMIRIGTGGMLAWLLAIPLREPLVTLLVWFGMPLIQIDPSVSPEVSLGLIGVGIGTVVGGYVEVHFLKRKLAERIGPVSSAIGYEIRLLICAIAAGAGAHFVGRPMIPLIAGLLPSRYGIDDMGAAGVVCFLFGVIYITLTIVFGIREGRLLLRRIPGISRWSGRMRQ